MEKASQEILNTHNRRIAEFLGHKVITADELTEKLRAQRKDGVMYTIKEMVDSELKYHESWDWLMPVIAKITEVANKNPNNTYIFSEFINSDTHRDMFMDNREVVVSSDLNGAYSGVIRFLEWYDREYFKLI